ncbi:Glycosyl transferase family 2 [Bradyrhizobium sp. Rc2d]|nr:Glycosyl transferase family 2 [Bradyrhizobium sp. Rc2d]
MISIVVPAHNESSVIARTLNQWVNRPGSEELSIVVVCNGCNDDTATIARHFGPTVRVIESDIAGKTHALNVGDQISSGFPRIYVDADVVVTLEAIRALAKRLERGDVLAVAPAAYIDLTGCSQPVRLYFGIRSRLPSSRQGFGGSGVYALSEAGRIRFAQFPNVIADDTFVRLQFGPEERETLSSVSATVFPPRRIRQLIAVRTRAYAGNFELARRFPTLSMNKGESNNRTLIGLFKHSRLWPGLLIYCLVNILALGKAMVRSRIRASVWQRDDTSRRAPPTLRHNLGARANHAEHLH